jgi:hypothetical protein
VKSIYFAVLDSTQLSKPEWELGMMTVISIVGGRPNQPIGIRRGLGLVGSGNLPKSGANDFC